MKKFYLNLLVAAAVSLPASVFAMDEDGQRETTSVRKRPETFRELLSENADLRDQIIVVGDLKARDLAAYSCTAKDENTYIYQWYRSFEKDHTIRNIWKVPSLWERSFDYSKDLKRYIEKCRVLGGPCPMITFYEGSQAKQRLISADDYTITKIFDKISIIRIKSAPNDMPSSSCLDGFCTKAFSINKMLQIQFCEGTKGVNYITEENKKALKDKYGDQLSFDKFD